MERMKLKESKNRIEDFWMEHMFSQTSQSQCMWSERTEKRERSTHNYLMMFQWITAQCITLEILLHTNPALSVTVAYFRMIHYLCQQWLRFRALAFVVHMICGWQNCCWWRFGRDKGGGKKDERGRAWLIVPAYYLKLMAPIQNHHQGLLFSYDFG